MPPGGPGPGNGKPPMGYEAPSNIISAHDGSGWFYAIMQVWPYQKQESNTSWAAANDGWAGSGNCFIRTRDLTDPKSWRGYNGARGAWDINFVDPYNSNPGLEFDPSEHVCTPVLNLGYPSIAWSTFYGKYIAVGSQVSMDTCCLSDSSELNAFHSLS